MNDKPIATPSPSQPETEDLGELLQTLSPPPPKWREDLTEQLFAQMSEAAPPVTGFMARLEQKSQIMEQAREVAAASGLPSRVQAERAAARHAPRATKDDQTSD